MKTRFLAGLVTVATVTTFPIISYAQPVKGPYVALGAGVDFLQDEIEKPSNGGPLPRNYVFDPGFAGQASSVTGSATGFASNWKAIMPIIMCERRG